MRKTSKQLKEERAAVDGKIAELSKVEARTDAQNTELTALFESRESLTNAIEAELRLEKFEAEQAANEARKAGANGAGMGDNENKEKRKFTLGKIIEARLQGKAIDGLEREMLDDANSEARSLGISPKGIYLSSDILNVLHEKRTMSAGSATAGGNTIQTDKVGFFQALYAKRVLQSLGVKYLTGLSNNVDLTGLGTGVTTGWALETANAVSGDPVTASRPMTPHRLAAYIDLSNQLLIQNPSLEGYVMESFMEAIYVAVEAAYINGSNADGQPLGLLSTPNIQDVAIGATGGAPTLAKILELVQKLGTANANVENLKFLINPKVEAKLKQTSIDGGSGAMIMAYQNYFSGTPGVIDGKITGLTSNVPNNLEKSTSGAVLSAIICGEFNKSVIGQFGGMDMIVDTVSQAIGGKVRIVGNTFWDMAFEQPAVFGAIKDATT